MNESLFGLIIQEISLALTPLSEFKHYKDDAEMGADEIFRILEKIGYKPPRDMDSLVKLAGLLSTIWDEVKQCREKLAAAGDSPGAIDYLKEIITLLLNIAPKVAEFVKAVLADIKDSNKTALKAFFSQENLAGDLARRLVDFLILDHLAKQRSGVYSVLLLTGVCANVDQEEDEAAFKSACSRPVINWDAVVKIFGKPEDVFKSQYFKADNSFDADKFLANLDLLVRNSGMLGGKHPLGAETKALLQGADNPNAREMRMQLYSDNGWPGNSTMLSLNAAPVTSSISGGGKAAYSGLGVYASGGAAFGIDITDTLSNTIKFDLSSPIMFKFGQGGLSVAGPSGAGQLTGSVNNKLTYKPDKPMQISAFDGGIRVGFGSLSFVLELRKGDSGADFMGELEIGQLFLALGSGDGDAFMDKLLPSEAVRIALDLTLGWSKSKGFYIKCGIADNGVFSLVVPINKTVFGILINSANVELRSKDKELMFSVSLSFSAEVGPVSFLINKMGLAYYLESTSSGSIGALAKTGIKWPESVGLSIDAGPVSGGGFFAATETGYQGLFYLSVKNTFSLTAIAIITTKPPDGNYFSLKILGNVTFTPIQLGFGFFISGIGVMLAIHTEMNQEKIQEGLYKGSLGNILFPEDPLKNAVKIIKDINTFFPSCEGSYVFGVMARIGWGGGTPILEGDVGFYFEVGNRFKLAIAALIKVVLPNKENKVVNINLAVFGVFDEEKKTISVDATLFDSKILTFKITGDMAMRMCYGNNPYFALSIGGFYPGYKVPSNFPKMKRLSVMLGGDDMHIEFSAYLAVVESSVQFGAALHLLYEQDFGKVIGLFRLEGGVGFDVLLVFKPKFYFECGIYLWLRLSRNNKSLLFIEFRANLSGPNRFHVWGKATFQILCFTIGFKFNHYFGKEKLETSLPSSHAGTLLHAELTRGSNWSVVSPEWVETMVSYRSGEDVQNYLNVNGGLRFTQNLMPLEFPVEKLGETEIIDKGDAYAVVPRIGAGEVAVHTDDEMANFSTGMFKYLTNTEKISVEPFTMRKAGFSVTADYSKVSGENREALMGYNVIAIGGGSTSASPSKANTGAASPTTTTASAADAPASDATAFGATVSDVPAFGAAAETTAPRIATVQSAAARIAAIQGAAVQSAAIQGALVQGAAVVPRSEKLPVAQGLDLSYQKDLSEAAAVRPIGNSQISDPVWRVTPSESFMDDVLRFSGRKARDRVKAPGRTFIVKE